MAHFSAKNVHIPAALAQKIPISDTFIKKLPMDMRNELLDAAFIKYITKQKYDDTDLRYDALENDANAFITWDKFIESHQCDTIPFYDESAYLVAKTIEESGVYEMPSHEKLREILDEL